MGAAERVFEILEMEPTIGDPPAPAPLPTPVRGRVAFENVSFRYQPDAELAWTLDEVTLAVAPGEVVALVGPSGGGKTTLVSLLPRFWDVDQGRITLDGVDVRALRLADLRGAIGIVPQEPALFSGIGPGEHRVCPPRGVRRRGRCGGAGGARPRVRRAAAPGLRHAGGERGVKLSGGQRQRVAIARAILKDPAVLILDEATSNLDTESERLIEDALERLLVGRTTLIIAHRLSTVQRADRLMVLDHGRIVEEGTHGELMALGGLYARLYQRQFRDEPRMSAAGPDVAWSAQGG